MYVDCNCPPGTGPSPLPKCWATSILPDPNLSPRSTARLPSQFAIEDREQGGASSAWRHSPCRTEGTRELRYMYMILQLWSGHLGLRSLSSQATGRGRLAWRACRLLRRKRQEDAPGRTYPSGRSRLRSTPGSVVPLRGDLESATEPLDAL